MKVVSDGKGENTAELSVFWDAHHDKLGIGDFPNLLASLLQLLPNLRILMIGTYQEQGGILMSDSRLFKSICDLKSLKYLSLFDRVKSTADVSRLISNFPGLLSFNINRGVPQPDPTDMTRRILELPSLKTLSIRSHPNTFVEYLNNWAVPELKSLGVAFSYTGGLQSSLLSRNSCPITSVQILNLAGPDATLSFSLDMSEILRLFPSLQELAFTIEWELRGALRHETLNRIGFYGGVGTLFEFRRCTPPPPWLLRNKRSAIANITALTKSKFPRLSTIQLLSPGELHHFLYSGGAPALSESASATWMEWRRRCSRENIRVLDCTGNEFGTRPEFEGVDEFTIFKD